MEKKVNIHTLKKTCHLKKKKLYSSVLGPDSWSPQDYVLNVKAYYKQAILRMNLTSGELHENGTWSKWGSVRRCLCVPHPRSQNSDAESSFNPGGIQWLLFNSVFYCICMYEVCTVTHTSRAYPVFVSIKECNGVKLLWDIISPSQFVPSILSGNWGKICGYQFFPISLYRERHCQWSK